MMSMAVMLGAQEGASLANVAINELFSNLIKTLMKSSSTLSNSMKQFAGAASQAEKIEATLNNKIIGKAIDQISKKESSQSSYTIEMQDYIFKAVSLHKPETYYLLGTVSTSTEFDQAFTNGTMYTPAGRIWKNVFEKGNWEYSEENDSFIQLSKTELKPVSSESPFSSGVYNSIFTEHQTFKNQYEIKVEVTLHHLNFPFCAGILFNKSRWISGNADSLTKSRLVVIYGSNSEDTGFYFAEQKENTNNKKNGKSELVTLYPLDQIISGSEKVIKIISASKIKDVHDAPVTFIIRIRTSPKKLEFKFWQKKETEPNQFITIKSTDPKLFMYHDIGFISSGAIAEFKVLKPVEILYNKEEIENYRKEVDQLINSKD